MNLLTSHFSHSCDVRQLYTKCHEPKPEVMMSPLIKSHICILCHIKESYVMDCKLVLVRINYNALMVRHVFMQSSMQMILYFLLCSSHHAKCEVIVIITTNNMLI